MFILHIHQCVFLMIKCKHLLHLLDKEKIIDIFSCYYKSNIWYELEQVKATWVLFHHQTQLCNKWKICGLVRKIKNNTLKSFLNCSQLFFISWVFSGNIPSFIHLRFSLFLLTVVVDFSYTFFFSFFSYGISTDEYLKWWKICLANIVETTNFSFSFQKYLYTHIVSWDDCEIARLFSNSLHWVNIDGDNPYRICKFIYTFFYHIKLIRDDHKNFKKNNEN